MKGNSETQPSEPKIIKLEISKIDASTRMRPVSETGVAALVASIKELGVIKDAIHVRKMRRKGVESLVLMAGAHRLEAAKRLGWETIPARVWIDVRDDWAQLMEIDDNLAGADLSPLELAVFLARRKEVYERLHPETKRGGDRKSAGLENQTDIMPFAESVAEKRDLSKRHIERFVQIGSSLSDWEVASLEGLEKPISLKDLMFLARVKEEHVRVELVDHLKHSGGEKRDLAALYAQHTGATCAPVNPVDKAFEKLLETWTRAPKAAQRLFVEQVEGKLRDILGDALK